MLYFSFIGHYIADSLSHASFAWALISFLTVVAIGFFSASLVKIAGATDLNTKKIENDLIVSFRLAIFLGVIIVVIIAVIGTSASRSITNDGEIEALIALFTLSLSIPALYLQIVIFNFFNATKKTIYEVIYTWSFNATLASACIILVTTNTNFNFIHFAFIYSGLRLVFTCLALALFDLRIRQHIFHFSHSQPIPKTTYVNYFVNGLPMAICFGGESLLYFIFSFISKTIGDTSLSAYQASLHFFKFRIYDLNWSWKRNRDRGCAILWPERLQLIESHLFSRDNVRTIHIASNFGSMFLLKGGDIYNIFIRHDNKKINRGQYLDLDPFLII